MIIDYNIEYIILMGPCDIEYVISTMTYFVDRDIFYYFDNIIKLFGHYQDKDPDQSFIPIFRSIYVFDIILLIL
jgi:hypothetical protein